MAATKTSRNETPSTPDVAESKIARMKVGELRRRLRDHGVEPMDDMKKPELVKKLIKAEKSGAKKSASAKKSISASAASSGSAKSSASTKSGKKDRTARNDTPNTPDVDESGIARMKADELRRELKNRGVKGTAGLKKPELVSKFIKLSAADSRKSSASASSSSTKGGGGKRTGKATSDSLKYAQEIRSTSDKPERQGRSLVTTDHEVIRQWAEARGAVPSTVPGTDHDGHLGVLRLDFPGYSGDRLREVSWDEWFDAFDKRRLNFIYQQKQTSGKKSNFFQLENPDE